VTIIRNDEIIDSNQRWQSCLLNDQGLQLLITLLRISGAFFQQLLESFWHLSLGKRDVREKARG
jgi:hypothetical protein